MLKYALMLTGNKSAAKTIVKSCRTGYNKNLAWFNKQKQIQQQKIYIKKACHNWLHAQVMALINNRKNQPAYPSVTTAKQSLTQNYHQ